ncbi:MAG: hypothetical protein IBX63_03665 [Coriobacteriia bacterium]|nr:hypothetical protein [Coriobacteriia bacterium]
MVVDLLVIVAGSSAALSLLGGPTRGASFLPATLSSLVVALAAAALSELVFTPEVVCPPVRPAFGSMCTADAEVDELLRLISTAEEEGSFPRQSSFSACTAMATSHSRT